MACIMIWNRVPLPGFHDFLEILFNLFFDPVEDYATDLREPAVHKDHRERRILLLDECPDMIGNMIINQGKPDTDPVSIFAGDLFFQRIYSTRQLAGGITFHKPAGAVLIAGERGTFGIFNPDNFNLHGTCHTITVGENGI